MDFSRLFFVGSNGRCPVQEFLDELKRTDGIRNKGQAIPVADRLVARARLREWQAKLLQ